MSQIIQFPVRATEEAEVEAVPLTPGAATEATEWVEAAVREAISEIISGVSLATYESKVELFNAVYDAGFTTIALAHAETFLANLRRAAMRCDPKVAAQIYAAAAVLTTKLVA